MKIKSNCLTISGLTKSYSILLRALSKCLLDTDKHGASTTSLRSLLQYLTTLMVNKCFPTP